MLSQFICVFPYCACHSEVPGIDRSQGREDDPVTHEVYGVPISIANFEPRDPMWSVYKLAIDILVQQLIDREPQVLSLVRLASIHGQSDLRQARQLKFVEFVTKRAKNIVRLTGTLGHEFCCLDREGKDNTIFDPVGEKTRVLQSSEPTTEESTSRLTNHTTVLIMIIIVISQNLEILSGSTREITNVYKTHTTAWMCDYDTWLRSADAALDNQVSYAPQAIFTPASYQVRGGMEDVKIMRAEIRETMRV